MDIYKDISLERDLLYYDGPILSLFRDENKKPFLFYWVDFTTTHNTWLVCSPSEDRLKGYLEGSVDLRDLINSSSSFELVDTDHEANFVNQREIDLNDYPMYQTEPGVFYCD